jgi:hypothetical protein
VPGKSEGLKSLIVWNKLGSKILMRATKYDFSSTHLNSLSRIWEGLKLKNNKNRRREKSCFLQDNFKIKLTNTILKRK